VDVDCAAAELLLSLSPLLAEDAALVAEDMDGASVMGPVSVV
jgi:hypothetical protein